MTGIGFSLKRMAEGRSLAEMAGAYFYAVFLTAGAWIFVVSAIGALDWIACQANQCGVLPLFRSILIYNFCFSLVLTGPIAITVTRYVSDRIYGRTVAGVASAHASALGLFWALGALLVGPFYAFILVAPALVKLAAFLNFLLVGAAWISIPFLGAIKDYRTPALAFLAGALLTMGTAAAFRSGMNELALLIAFNVGLLLALAILAARIAKAFGPPRTGETPIIQILKQYPELPFLGFVYYLGVWADKIVVWLLSPFAVVVEGGVLRTMPDYDASMFWAQFITVPLLVIFFVHVETRFFALYRGFYGAIEKHATRRELAQRRNALAEFTLGATQGLFVGAFAIGAMAILASFAFFEILNVRAVQMGVFRAGAIGAAFQSSLMFTIIMLLYFDLRRQALAVATLFCVLNAGLTALFLGWGYAYLGFGYLVASGVSFAVALTVLTRELRWLDYHAFITTNASITRPLGHARPAQTHPRS